MRIRRYSELILLPTFEERFNYLSMVARIGVQTFGFDRYLNQMLYQSLEWKQVRNEVIIRDEGCDLGIEDFPVTYGIRVHHMNPITVEDIEESNPAIFDPEFLICCSADTHQAIHYGSEPKALETFAEREPNDQVPWK